MSENLKTIKELADELGISKQGVQYHLNYYHLKTRQKNNRGIIILTHEEQEFVRNRVRLQSAKDTEILLGTSKKFFLFQHIDVEALIQRYILPVRPNRSDERKLVHKGFGGFLYRIA